LAVVDSLPRPMTRSRSLPLALVLAAFALTTCEVGDDDPPSPPPPSTSPPPTLSADGFLYTSKEGIRALATFRGDRGTLELENGTDAELAPPGLYLLDAMTGEVVPADVTPARPVGDGEERMFRVSLARAMPASSIGLVVLLIGDEDRGAFLPPAAVEPGA
jgi:hypothetical protein